MKMKVIFNAAFMAAFLFHAGANVYAQAEVVESNNRLIDRSQAPASANAINPSASGLLPAAASNSAQSASDAFYQLQLLQQEVSQLRGLVEEQSYEIKRLKQQRLDDYISLDRRISSMGGSASTSGGEAASDTSSTINQSLSVAQPTTDGNELVLYQAAVDLSLKQKDYQQGASAFKKYLATYPKGRYMANSQYWLGELALLEGDLESAREWFSLVVNQSPEHDKSADATYKLGTVYHKLGDSEKAKELLNRVAAGSSSASRLAKGYIANMIDSPSSSVASKPDLVIKIID